MVTPAEEQIKRLQRGQAELADTLDKVKRELKVARNEMTQLREKVKIEHTPKKCKPWAACQCYLEGVNVGQSNEGQRC